MIVYVFATADPVIAVVFLVWNALIMVLDNVLATPARARRRCPDAGSFRCHWRHAVVRDHWPVHRRNLLALGYKLAGAWLEGDSERALAASDDL